MKFSEDFDILGFWGYIEMLQKEETHALFIHLLMKLYLTVINNEKLPITYFIQHWLLQLLLLLLICK